jgi:hypothetical protein
MLTSITVVSSVPPEALAQAPFTGAPLNPYIVKVTNGGNNV